MTRPSATTSAAALAAARSSSVTALSPFSAVHYQPPTPAAVERLKLGPELHREQHDGRAVRASARRAARRSP
jgi:hypothetical protein